MTTDNNYKLGSDYGLMLNAAKAINLSDIYWMESTKSFYIRTPGKNDKKWNPLKDDDDAFRLFIQLGMNIEHWTEHNRVKISFGEYRDCVFGPYNDDPVAATRRAIVYAAAEMGKLMEKKQ